jgi:hypothetical protein
VPFTPDPFSFAPCTMIKSLEPVSSPSATACRPNCVHDLAPLRQPGKAATGGRCFVVLEIREGTAYAKCAAICPDDFRSFVMARSGQDKMPARPLVGIGSLLATRPRWPGYVFCRNSLCSTLLRVTGSPDQVCPPPSWPRRLPGGPRDLAATFTRHGGESLCAHKRIVTKHLGDCE